MSKIIYVAMTADLLHAGHINVLKIARKKAKGGARAWCERVPARLKANANWGLSWV